MKVKVITLFPEIINTTLGAGVLGKALKKNLWYLSCINLKDVGPHIDDTPYGGGAGMIIKTTSLENILDSCKNVYFMSPRGKTFYQKDAEEMSSLNEITILCGRYEGIDQRLIEYYQLKELSIGDYILCGGEVAACVVLESVIRLIPNVLHNNESILQESFTSLLIEHDHYTTPKVWRNLSVPEVLFSGNHFKINQFRYFNAIQNTYMHTYQWNKFRIFFICSILVIYINLSSNKRKYVKKIMQ